MSEGGRRREKAGDGGRWREVHLEEVVGEYVDGARRARQPPRPHNVYRRAEAKLDVTVVIVTEEVRQSDACTGMGAMGRYGEIWGDAGGRDAPDRGGAPPRCGRRLPLARRE